MASSFVITHTTDTTVHVAVRCPFCNKEQSAEYPMGGFVAWKNGKTIQAAMPSVSLSDREKLISGMCDECWPEEM